MHSVLMDDACILKTHVFMQRWCDIAIVVFIIKSPHLAYSVDNRQHSTSATLNIGLNIGFSEHRNNRPSEQSAKCNIGQALVSVSLCIHHYAIYFSECITHQPYQFLFIDRNSSFFPENSVSAVKLITGYIFCPLLSCVLSLMDGPCSYPSKTTVVPTPYCRTVKSAYN